MHRYSRGIEDLDEAINLLPGNAAAYVIRGSAYAAMRQYQRSIEDIDQGIKLDPTCFVGFLYRGMTYELKGEQDHALADYSRAIDLSPNPTSADGFTWRAFVYSGKRDYDRAVQDLTRAIELDPKMLADCITAVMFKRGPELLRGLSNIATKRCGHAPMMADFTSAAALPISKWGRLTTPSAISTPY
jgi:tetratricopeptide (TPR) repeat protein